MKKKSLLGLVLILVLPLVYSGNFIPFIEPFGNEEFNLSFDYNYDIVNQWYTPITIIHNTNLTTQQNISFGLKDWYRIQKLHFAGANDDNFILSNDVLTVINSTYGLNFTTGGDGSASCNNNNCVVGFGTVLDTSVKLEGNSQISYYCRTSSTTRSMQLQFNYINGSTIFGLQLNGASSIARGAGVEYMCNIGTNCTGTKQFKNFTINDLRKNCSSANATLENIEQIALKGFFGNLADNEEFYFDDLYVGFFNGTNLIPTFNLTVNDTTPCINEGLSTNINLTIDAVDIEGDTILYAVNSVDFLRRFTIIERDFSLNPYSFLRESIFITNQTLADTPAETNLWKIGFYGSPRITIGSVGGNNLLLTESGSQDWLIDIGEELINSTTIFYTTGFSRDGLAFSNSFYDGFGNEILKLTFNQTLNGNLTIYINDTLYYNTLRNLYDNDGDNWIDITLGFNPNLNVTRIFINEQEGEIFLIRYNNSFSGVRMFNFDTLTPYNPTSLDTWIFDNLIIRGWNYFPRPSFTTSYNNIIQINSTNIFYVVVYVTDDVNVDNDLWRTEEIKFTPVQCKYKVDIPQEYDDAGAVLKSSFRGMCSSFDVGLGGVGFSWCWIILIFGIAGSLIVSIMLSYIVRFFGISSLDVFLVSFSLSMIGINIFIYELSIEFKIIIGVLFAIGLIKFIITNFILSSGVASSE